jgi:outer membrane receptor protein involved in Fe transport
MCRLLRCFSAFLLFTLLLVLSPSSFSQNSGTIRGKVTDRRTGEALPSVNIVVRGTATGAATDPNGEYVIENIPAGTYTLIARLVGHETSERRGVVVSAGKSTTLDFELLDTSVMVGDITVYGASKRAERITEAPAAVSSIPPQEIRLNSAHGQLPRLLEVEPGVDIVQSGVQDFNINTRGFNSSLNRRLLVLMDGRDLAIAFLGAQEWNGLPIPLEDISRLELVRGPGSALYGPNAFNGVINITTPAPKEVLGTKVTLAGGELSMFRGDLRHAGMIDDRWSYKANIGRVQSKTWSKSRVNPPYEYPGLPAELRPLDTDDVVSTYGTARIDYAYDEATVATVEGGYSEVQNEVFVTGIGRVQVKKAGKPWGRINVGSDRFNVMLWGQGRSSIEPQYSLASRAPLNEKSSIYNAEAQYNFRALDDQLSVIAGASHRIYNVDTEGTLMAEKKNDNTSGVFGQLEYEPLTWLKLVAAARWDRSTLHKSQVSPKGGIVWTPTPNHSLRATYNKAFQVPNYSEFFLQAAAGAANVPFFASPTNPNGTIPILARGNSALIVEKITGYEVGYKGIFLDSKVFVTIDGYFNRLNDFITDLLQGVNPAYPFNVPPGFPAGLIDIARASIPGLAIVNGGPAVVVSYTNAGKVDETGTEVAISFYPNDHLRFSGNWTWYDFKVKEQQAGDVLLPNAPKHKFGFGAFYSNTGMGLDAQVTLRNVQPFRWAAGIFQGEIPAYTLVNLGAAYQFSQHYRIGVTVSNLLDHDVYQLFGGSVIGRQAIGSITATF